MILFTKQHYMFHSLLRTFWFIALLTIPSMAYGQFEFGNEWIDHSKTYYAFDIDEDGLYRVSYETLQASGIDLDVNGFRLFSKGSLVPIYISNPSGFGPGDYIEFVGHGNDGYFDTQLYENPEWQPNDDESLFSPASRYYLVSDASLESAQFTTLENDISNPAPTEEYFIYTKRASYFNVFYRGDAGSQGWTSTRVSFSDFEDGEGFLSPQISDLPFTTNLITEGVNTNAGLDASLEVKYAPGSNTVFTLTDDHHFQVKVNDNIILDHSQNGIHSATLSNSFPASILTDPVSSFIYEHIDDLVIDPQDGDYQDRGSLAYAECTYPRNFSFGSDAFFEFEIDNTNALFFEASDFDGDNSVVLYDLNNKTRLTADLNNGVYPFNLDSSNEQRHLVLASTQVGDVQEISNLVAKNFVDYSDLENIGDILMVYHQQLRQGSPDGIDQVERYKAYRESAEGGNHKVIDVDINDLYDQFAHGIIHHPLAIQNFTNFVFEQTDGIPAEYKAEYLLLLGRSIVYSDSRNVESENYAINLVPTYGSNGSDNLLSAKKGLNHLPLLATGRISAIDGSTIKKYLDKLIEYEALMLEPQPCTKEDRRWMKDAMHLGGGKNVAEAEQFGNFLDGYGEIIDDTFMGAEVVATYVKDEVGVVAAPPELVDIVDDGIAILTLFGHSNAEIFDFGLAPPEDYNNQGKYPFLMSNSCFIGNVHQEGEDLMAFRYLHVEDKGFMAFLATVGFGFPSFLDRFTTNLFENATTEMYGEPLGKIIQRTHTNSFFDDIEQFGSVSAGTVLHSQEFTLQGDPVLPLYHFDRPEYLVEESDIIITPSQPSILTENIELEFVINNLGKAIEDSIDVIIDHLLPDNSTNILFSGKVPPVAYRDTVSITLPNASDYFGINGLRIFVDPNNEIEEDCEDNNQFTKSLLVLGEQPFPLVPCNLAKVSTQPVVLKANTPGPIMTTTDYRFEIDTTPSFDSPDLVSTTISQVGGVLAWEAPINYVDGQVYYWRTTRDTANPIWQTQSFLFDSSSAQGWAQSNSLLLSENETENLNWNDDFTQYTIEFGFDDVTISSPTIGPASSWGSVVWDVIIADDETALVEVWSVSNPITGNPAELLISDDSNTIDLSSIDPQVYPKISLRFVSAINNSETPAQLNSWEVQFEGVPELSFNQAHSYAFSSDTIANSANGEFLIGVSNVNEYDSEAIQIDCRIIDNNNSSQSIPCPDIAALNGNSDAELQFSFETGTLAGNNVLQIEMNPVPAFSEKYYFNNQLSLPFFVQSDKINPIVDVSFDGVNIINNDLVSSSPDIFIQVRDENTVQALADTSVAEVFLEYPSGLLKQIALDDPSVIFSPADPSNLDTENVASINFQPNFTEDGFYQLRIKASDASGNQSSNQYDYSIRFEVVTTNSISNVVNYPNPFTTHTQFVYTLAGNEVPEVFRIQVMTPGGKVVREFGQDELGVPRFGKNITDFVWDGTDSYGNELANGVYFFRVIANTAGGDSLELYSNEFTKKIDDSFGEYSVGKMYKMR